jgi:hypothetical protein
MMHAHHVWADGEFDHVIVPHEVTEGGNGRLYGELTGRIEDYESRNRLGIDNSHEDVDV